MKIRTLILTLTLGLAAAVVCLAEETKQQGNNQEIWQDMLATPGFVISWKATKVEVAKSGDLAFVSGTYEDYE
jgi:ketosteroid isomerase-like protein